MESPLKDKKIEFKNRINPINLKNIDEFMEFSN